MFEIGDMVCCECGSLKCPKGKIVDIDKRARSYMVYNKKRDQVEYLDMDNAMLINDLKSLKIKSQVKNYITKEPTNKPYIGGA